MEFIDAVRQRVTRPHGFDEVFVARTRRDRRLPGEGFYEAAGAGPTAEYPTRTVERGLPYGGGGFLTEAADSALGLAASARAVARLIGHYAAYDRGPRTPGGARSGNIAGAYLFAISRHDDLDACLIINASHSKSADDAN